MKWFVYILGCADGTLYTGCSNDVVKRVRVHNAGTGAKYTYSRRPVKLLYQEEAADRAAAQKREYQLKRLTRLGKLQLIGTQGKRSANSQ